MYPPDLSRQEQAFLNCYRAITPLQRQILDHLASGYAAAVPHGEFTRDNVVSFPCKSVAATA